MKTWKMEVTVSVADNWVEDGFDMTKRANQIKAEIKNMLPYAYDHEMAVTVKIKPVKWGHLKHLKNESDNK